jgi:hypothetical protein
VCLCLCVLTAPCHGPQAAHCTQGRPQHSGGRGIA